MPTAAFDRALDLLQRAWAQLGPAAVTVLRVTLILLLAWLLTVVLRRMIRALRLRIANRLDDPEAAKRAQTLDRVFRNLVTVVVWLLAGTLVLAELGVSVAPILGAAGVVGLAVGFGAQSLVRDYFTGFFLLLENQIRQGDVVQLGEHGGLVEEITLRYVQLRDYDGNVHFVPNGQITTVVNKSRGFAQAVVDVRVAYSENVDAVIELMREVGRELRAVPAYGARILDALEIAGVERLEESALIVRCRFKVRPLEQWEVRREYQRRLKAAFDAHGIQMPYPHLAVYAGPVADDRAGRAGPAGRAQGPQAQAAPGS